MLTHWICRGIFKTHCCAGTSPIITLVWGLRGTVLIDRTIHQSYSYRFCVAMHRPVLVLVSGLAFVLLFYVFPCAASLPRRACEVGGRFRFGSDYDPSRCNSTLCFSKPCSFLLSLCNVMYFGLNPYF